MSDPTHIRIAETVDLGEGECSYHDCSASATTFWSILSPDHQEGEVYLLHTAYCEEHAETHAAPSDRHVLIGHLTTPTEGADE